MGGAVGLTASCVIEQVYCHPGARRGAHRCPAGTVDHTASVVGPLLGSVVGSLKSRLAHSFVGVHADPGARYRSAGRLGERLELGPGVRVQ